MGRRKIEIKAIKDDRNRSVTFLKRKGGLFKKAHELSVLCSVDVAVIIFGTNKKLYEYSSGDINQTIHRFSYYQGPHEHKGPADFSGGTDEDEDEDMGTPPVDDALPRQTSLPPHVQQHGFQRSNTNTPPPTMNTNGAPYHQRPHTPQPQVLSRPASSQGMRRSSLSYQPSQLNQVSQMNAPDYTYMRGGTINGPLNNGTPASSNSYPNPQNMPSNLTNGQNSAASQHYYAQLQQAVQQGSYTRQAGFSQLSRSTKQEPSPPPPDQLQPQTIEQVRGIRLQQPKATKSRSMFTPIDDSRSMLAQHWGPTKQAADSKETVRTSSRRMEAFRAASPDSSELASPLLSDSAATPASASAHGGGKRPKLKVHIPDEQSEDESGAETGKDAESKTTGAGAKNSRIDPALSARPEGKVTSQQHQGVVLPPPSPIGANSSMLSAGATGPLNPFARPLQSQATGNTDRPAASGRSTGVDGTISEQRMGTGAKDGKSTGTSDSSKTLTAVPSHERSKSRQEALETPLSALPSRFVAEGFLPSPSAFYPEWGLSGNRTGGESAILPSPLTWGLTPVATQSNGPSALSNEVTVGSGEKRKSADGGDDEGGDGAEPTEHVANSGDKSTIGSKAVRSKRVKVDG